MGKAEADAMGWAYMNLHKAKTYILLEPGPGIVPDKLAPNPSFAQSSLPGQYHPANPRPESYRLSAKGPVTSAPWGHNHGHKTGNC